MSGSEREGGPSDPGKGDLQYSRRDAMRALVKYSAALGGAATVVVTADGLVSEASAYNCQQSPNNPHCNGNTGGGAFQCPANSNNPNCP